MGKTLQPEEKRNKQTIFQLISQKNQLTFFGRKYWTKNKTNYNSGSSKTKKGAKKKNDSHRFAYNENDYDYANAVNIDNFSTFSFK